MVAISMLVLMGFAALAIDYGRGVNERRQDTIAADMAALAALQFARGAQPVDNGAREAIAVANANLDEPAKANWAACTDPNRPAKFTRISTLSQCVSFTANLRESRVVIPKIAVETTFARLLGFIAIITSGEAEAKADLDNPGGVLPFGVGPSSAGLNQVCLKTGPPGHTVSPLCDGPTGGNFGYLDISLYGNDSLGTPQICGAAQQNTKTVANIAIGVDHPLSTWTTGDTTRNDWNLCPDFYAMPNELRTQPGNRPQNVDQGLRSGAFGHPGRLARGDHRTSVSSSGPTLDNQPLWAFITSGVKPLSCGSVSTTAQMETCMADWRSGSYGPLFTEAIADAVRYAYVPQFYSDVCCGRSEPYLISAFRAVYLHTTFWSCNSTGCRTVFEPMVAPTGSCAGGQYTSCGWPNGGSRIEALTAFLLTDSMLPQSVRDSFPGRPDQIAYYLTK